MEVVNSLVGKVIDARYELQELLGEGGSGSTYRAIRLTDQATVAIKILSLRHLNDWKQLELFEREAKVLAQLDHPQIPKYLEYFHVDTPDNRAFYIVQQLAPGKPLTAWVQSGWQGTTAEVQDIASQILEVLQYLHQQEPPLVHRDIKPHNIVRNDDGKVFLVDFGAVQDVYNHTLIRGSTVAGTYGYMAPEQFRGQAVPASDLYGLGATMLYLLTHRSPAELPQERLKLSFRKHVNLPDYLADWLDMMLEPDVADRFPSAIRALAALQQQHRFRIQKGVKVGFPWKGAAAALAALCLTLPLVHQYRYVFLTLVGLQPRDLCSSIERNDLSIVKDYLSHGGNPNVNINVSNVNARNDVNSFDSNTTSGSLLHCAISAGKPQIVQYLLQHGINAQSFDGQGITPLNRAIYQYDQHDYKCAERKPDCSPMYQVIELLAKTPGIDINIKSEKYSAKDVQKESALFLAVRLKNQMAVKQLLSLGANTDTQNGQKSNLWHALAWGNIVSIKPRMYLPNEEPNETNTEFAVQRIAIMLFVKNQDINHQNDQGNSPLHLAVMSDNKTMVNFLLGKKANINSKKQGFTPLMEAVLKGNLELTKQLLAAGASANELNNEGNTALHLNFLAVRSGTISDSQFKTQTEIMTALLQKGANPNLENIAGDSVIHSLANVNTTISSGMCIHQNRDATKLLDVLVSKGADRQAINNQGQTALHKFAVHNDLRLMKSAISYNWQLSSKTHYSLTPLEIAANHHGIMRDNMQRILDPKFKVDQRDDRGNTMLHQAVSTGDSDLVKVLMNLGANTQAANYQGQTPLSLARQLASSSKTEKFTSTHGFINQCQIENLNNQKSYGNTR
jgi:serine/threonine protein kinase